MKILVIGGAGYIGSHVVKELVSSGHDAWVYDNLSSGKQYNVLVPNRFYHASIFDEDKLDAVMSAGWDAVIHLAALKAAGESMEKPGIYAHANIAGSIAVLNAMARHSVRRIVFSSTAAVYGEPQYVPIDEAHPTDPVNFYGFTKLKIEELLNWYHRLHGVSFVALRYFNAAGYSEDGSIGIAEDHPQNLLPIILEVATGRRPELLIYGDNYDTPDGSGVRDYVHVSDLASAHTAAVRYLLDNNDSLTVNLGSNHGISVFEMLEAVRQVTTKPIPSRVIARRKGDPAIVIASSSLAKSKFGWGARYSDVETLVQTAWKVYNAH